MKISSELYEQIVEHAQRDTPNECCGMVGAREDTAVKVYPARNIEASPFRFMIEPSEQLRIHNEIEEAGLELGAIYHSHTRTEPRPSQMDINFAEGWPGVVWIIVGLAGPEVDVRAWLIEDGAVSDTRLAVAR